MLLGGPRGKEDHAPLRALVGHFEPEHPRVEVPHAGQIAHVQTHVAQGR